MRLFCPIALFMLATPAFAQDKTGFYLGLDVASFDAEFENLTVDGDGTAFGIHAGYRFSLSDASFAEVELFAANLNGRTDTGNTEFDSYAGLTLGVGVALTDAVSATLFGGIGEVSSSNPFLGDATNDATLVGVRLGYDVTPTGTIAFQVTRAKLDGMFGDIDTDLVGLRYSHRF